MSYYENSIFWLYNGKIYWAITIFQLNQALNKYNFSQIYNEEKVQHTVHLQKKEIRGKSLAGLQYDNC